MLKVFTKIGFILLIVLLIINVFAFVLFQTAQQPVTFTAMLDQFSKAPVIDLSIQEIRSGLFISDNWSISIAGKELGFNWLRDFINIFSYFFSFIAWIGVILLNIVIGISYLLYLLGVQSFSVFV